MGKNKNSSFEVFDSRINQIVPVDSNEEVLVYKWLMYAQSKDIILKFQYQPCTFTLSEKVTYKHKNKTKTLFQDHVYSPDFEIEWNPKYEIFQEEFKYPFGWHKNNIYVDVKGSFNRNQRSFSIDQKWVFQRYGFYIYKLEPKKFFKKVGILEEFKFTQKTKKPSKIFEGYPLIDDILKISK